MPQGRVFAFEMEDLSHAIALKNVALNRLDRVRVILSAVGAAPGEVSYERPAEERWPDPTRRLATDPPSDVDGEAGSPTRVRVPMTTLDHFFADEPVLPDVVKIDVEGADLQVLKGMADILARARPLLFLELHPKSLRAFSNTADEVLAYLEAAGYECRLLDAFRYRAGEQTRPLPVAAGATLHENSMLLCSPRASG
jgi:FkbM family methyltransferase